MTTATATTARPKAKAGMTLCLWAHVGERRQGPTRPETHALCALLSGHDWMHIMQTRAQLKRWWPDA